MAQILSPIRTATPQKSNASISGTSAVGSNNMNNMNRATTPLTNRARTPGNPGGGGTHDGLSESQSAIGTRPNSTQEARRARSRQSSREQAAQDAKFKGRRRRPVPTTDPAVVNEGTGALAPVLALKLTAEEEAQEALLDQQEADMAEMERKFEVCVFVCLADASG